MIRANLITQKKGISPIIATLLLILIAIAAGVIVYAYVVGFVGSSTSGQPSGTSQISIDTASGSSSGSSVTGFVRNIGGTTASINAIYVLDSTGTIVTGGSLIGTHATPYTACTSPVTLATSIPCTLAPQASIQVSLSGVTMSSGSVYTLKVTTVDGSTVTYTFKAS